MTKPECRMMKESQMPETPGPVVIRIWSFRILVSSLNRLRQDALYRLPMHIRQPVSPPLKLVSQAFVINP